MSTPAPVSSAPDAPSPGPMQPRASFNSVGSDDSRRDDPSSALSRATNGLLSGAGAISGAGTTFPAPSGRSVSPREMDLHADEEEQELLSSPTRTRPYQSPSSYASYGPGAPPISTFAQNAAQYPLPSSRQQSFDTSSRSPPLPSTSAYADIPNLANPFPPPPTGRSGIPEPQSSSPRNYPSSASPEALYAPTSSAAAAAVDPSPSLSAESSYTSTDSPSAPPPPSSTSHDAPPLPPRESQAQSQPQPPTSQPAGTDFDRHGAGLGLGRISEGGTATGAGSPARLAGMEQRRASNATGAGSVASAEYAAGGAAGEQEDVVQGGFDEGVLKVLCDMDEASNFLKKRAQIEEEYARSMVKLARSSIESYGLSEGKAGTYVTSYLSLLRTHELLGDNRLKFAAQLADMSEELVTLGKEVEKNRKASKELGSRLERGLMEQETLVDKARTRFDAAAEELERLLLLKSGESITPSSVPHASSTSTSQSKGRSFGKAMSKLKGPKNAAQVAKQEEETRSRMGQSSDAYRAQVVGAQTVRQEYFNLQLPRILRTLKEGADEIDLGTQYHLSRYAYLFESLLVTDGLTISPVSIEDGPGVKAVVDAIDVREDFKTYMQQYSLNWQMSGQRGPRREGPPEDGFLTRPTLSPRASSQNLRPLVPPTPSGPPTRPTFGLDLGEQMARDGVEVPRVLEKCAEAIELHGLESMGIYRLSGTTSRVQRLKGALDRDLEGTDLLSEDNLSDINDIAAVLKLWFRELPEPLLTWELYHQFIDVSKIENDRLRHIRLHERVNELPDPNYATLKYLMGHLDKVAQHESHNQMSVSNLAIVFGPNLLGAPPPHLAHHFPVPASSSSSGANGTSTQGGSLADMQWQCKCIETILMHYREIFVE
ncbi:SPOSA6832_03229, partial [Sporobolomyces salmonicolor]